MSIDKNWKETIDELGKDAFEKSEMIRLGFWKPELNSKNFKEEHERLLALFRQRASETQKLTDCDAHLKEAEDIQKQIEKIRAKRIKKSQAKRKIQKEEYLRTKQEKKDLLVKKNNLTPGFLGKGVSGKLNFSNEDKHKLNKNDLPSFKNLGEFASTTKVSTRFLTWLCYHKEVSEVDHYHRFKIPKRNGQLREISSPKPYLRWMQKWIKRNILEKVPVNDSAKAYRVGKSIKDNAIEHINKKVLLKIDLKDFFFSIEFPTVRWFFHDLGYSYGMATIFALICCDCPREVITYEGKHYYIATAARRLNQGAITSPILSNLIGGLLDKRLSKFVQSCDKDASYTRYADDLAFSFNTGFTEKTYSIIRKIIQEEGYEINPGKLKVMRDPIEKIITGIKCNGDQIRLPKKYIKKLRAEIYNAKKNSEELSTSVLGKINYVANINQNQLKKLNI